MQKTSENSSEKIAEKAIPRLFGTDGIRGTANEYPILPDLVVRVGQAIGILLKKQNYFPNSHPKVVIGKDTRLSGYMIEGALASGLSSMGVHVQLVGPLPTPGIGYLVRNMRAWAGIVISASHNAFHDNGIKIFGPDGYKFPDAMEREIERLVVSDDELRRGYAGSTEIGRIRRIEDSQGRYIVHAKSTFPLEYTLDGLRIVLDTANGAAYKVAPAIFQELGAEVIQIGNTPSGVNINDKTGALYPAKVAEAVLQYRADVGISLDGDADRVVMIDENGEVMNGDHILGICALHMKKKGTLKNDTLVVTHMSNFCLEKTMAEEGVKVVKVGVGDKYVVEELRKSGCNLGGEQSGHIIFLDHSTTGDGCIAALNVLAVMKETGKKMSELNSILEDVPQVLVNLRVKKKADLSQLAEYQKLVAKIEGELAGEGRVFVRFSGTEPLIRILVEGPDKLKISEYASELAALLERELL